MECQKGILRGKQTLQEGVRTVGAGDQLRTERKYNVKVSGKELFVLEIRGSYSIHEPKIRRH